MLKDFQQPAKAIALIGIVLAALYVIDSSETNGSSGHLAPTGQRKALADVTVRDLIGHSWRLADHRGEVVLLNFWATWCPPCREETPGLVRLSKSYPDSELDVIGVSMDEGGPAVVRQFVSQFKIPYTIAMSDDKLTPASTVEALPTTLLIDRQGRVAKTYVGGTSEKVFRADVDALLHEPAGE
jgi:cytochrome c biogenesis protein CcmG, thiol:disulfide interchange protein DsbE